MTAQKHQQPATPATPAPAPAPLEAPPPSHPSDDRAPSARAWAVVVRLSEDVRLAEREHRGITHQLAQLDEDAEAEQHDGTRLRAELAALAERLTTAQTASAMFAGTEHEARERDTLATLEAQHTLATGAAAAWEAAATQRTATREQRRAELTHAARTLAGALPDLRRQLDHAKRVHASVQQREGEQEFDRLMEPLLAARAQLAAAEHAYSQALAAEMRERSTLRDAARTGLANWPRLREQAFDECDDQETREDRRAEAAMAQLYGKDWAVRLGPTTAERRPLYDPPVPGTTLGEMGMSADDSAVRALLDRRGTLPFAQQARGITHYQEHVFPKLVEQAQQAAAAQTPESQPGTGTTTDSGD